MLPNYVLLQQSSESSLKFYRGYSSERELVSVEFQQELLRLKDYCGDEKQVAHKNQITWKDLSEYMQQNTLRNSFLLLTFAFFRYTSRQEGIPDWNLLDGFQSILWLFCHAQLYGNYFCGLWFNVVGQHVGHRYGFTADGRIVLFHAAGRTRWTKGKVILLVMQKVKLLRSIDFPCNGVECNGMNA